MHLPPIAQIDPDAVERLLDRAFGADRRARTAYKVRGTAQAIPHLSFAAVEDGALLGTVQCWPVRLSADHGSTHPLVMVGPVAVEPVRQGTGIGRALVTRALDAARGTGEDAALMLIGDAEYYRRFGFTADRTGSWRLPGPVERHRLLARGDSVPDLAGLLGPALDERTDAP